MVNESEYQRRGNREDRNMLYSFQLSSKICVLNVFPSVRFKEIDRFPENGTSKNLKKWKCKIGSY